MQAVEYDRHVFINCPFDSAYAPIFEAIVFAVQDAEFRPKCAREKLDSSLIRVQKIAALTIPGVPARLAGDLLRARFRPE